MKVQMIFWEISVSCCEAEGEYKDDIVWPPFPESISIVSRCVPNLNTAPKADVPRLASRPLL